MARFTDTQLDDARHADLEAYLRSRGETLRRAGGEYRWVYRDGAGEHDSVTVRGNEWYDHKRQLGGDAIGFLQEYMGMEFRTAVVELIGQRDVVHDFRFSDATDTKRERAPFVPPPRAPNMHRLYAYLCKSRCIDHGVVTHFVRAGTLYEDAQYHNAVFLATDEQGQPKGGMKKGTLSGSSFRQTITGSDTRYAFHHKGTSDRVYVFEAAVDMLSFITLYPQDWQADSYLVLDGVSSKPLRHFLDVHQEVRDVCLCLDHDQAGIDATKRIIDQLRQDGFDSVSMCQSAHKDWNDDLKSQTLSLVHDPPQPEMEMAY